MYIHEPDHIKLNLNFTRIKYVHIRFFFCFSNIHVHFFMWQSFTDQWFSIIWTIYRNSGSNHYHDHRAVFKSIQRWEFHFNFRSIERTKKAFISIIYLSNIKYNNFKFIHSFIAGKRPHRKPDTQILGDYGVEEWRDGGNIEMYFSVLFY